ncbi:unnamed protein product [Brassica rapa subsp. trilocularis]
MWIIFVYLPCIIVNDLSLLLELLPVSSSCCSHVSDDHVLKVPNL